MIFEDRVDAGKKLAKHLTTFKNKKNCIVLGLPRGGVVTAFHIAQELNLPLDIVVPRKIGAPDSPELAIGAITQDGEGSFDQKLIGMLRVPQSYIDQEVEKEKKEAQRRLETYRGKRPPLNLKGKTVILVDDGLATGATMKAAIGWVKKHNVDQLIVAVPVGPKETIEILKPQVDEIICLETPEPFWAIGQFYRFFPQTTDEEVIKLLKNVKNQ